MHQGWKVLFGWGLVTAALAAPPQGYAGYDAFRLSAEHQYGYGVALWRAGHEVQGVLLLASGLQGDTPAAALRVRAFDARSGRLHFLAQEAAGQDCEFIGVLSAARLHGRMRCAIDYRTGMASGGWHALTLRRSRDTPDFAERAEFLAWMSDYLARNGTR